MVLLVVFHTWFYLSGIRLAQNQKSTSKFPIRLPTAVKELTSLSQSQCFSPADVLDAKDKIRDITSNFTCGGSTGWTRVVYLNMTDPSHQCPLNWTPVSNNTIRGCKGGMKPGFPVCHHVSYSVNNKKYSSVCGRIVAYQRGSTRAFLRAIRGRYNNIESPYVSGVSLTHGRPGSRQHIWTFAGALYEQGNYYQYNTAALCPCTNTILPWPHTVPTFVGDDYFCETGNRGPEFGEGILFVDDPLWDGKGCGPTSTCCEFNDPPWMFKTLPYSTSDDLELRLCSACGYNRDNIYITLIEMYVK